MCDPLLVFPYFMQYADLMCEEKEWNLCIWPYTTPNGLQVVGFENQTLFLQDNLRNEYMDYTTGFIGIKIQFLDLISYLMGDFPPHLDIVSFPKTTYWSFYTNY